MNSNDNNIFRNDDQSTRKFDAVRPAGGVPIGERPVYGNRGADAQTNDRRAYQYPDAAAGRRVSPVQQQSAKNAPSKKKHAKSSQTAEQREKRRLGHAVRLVVALMIAALAVLVSVFIISCISDILPMYRSTDKISVSVNDSMTTDQVINMLADKGLIKNRGFCKLAAKLLKYDDTKYLTSVYELQPSYGLEKMLVTMSKSATGAETVTLYFPEGYNMEQIFAKLEANGVCSAASLRATAREMDFSSDYAFLKEIPNKDARYYYLEGYLYPDTYEFYIGENATSVIDRFLKNFENHWTEAYAESAAAANMTLDQVVTLASIIEKEAYGTEQMYLISSVLHNRLYSSSGEFLYLQCDSTSNYIDSIPDTVLSGQQRIDYKKVYDTYQCYGLPAGPICSPGEEAIKAALYPDDTDYFYFRHDVNKKIYLAETKRGHDRNGEEVLRVNERAAAGN
ncbi:MAG: endolytic transglycosylase MltG [Clostridia bacterium]|nr:endolytic transglycosylase MltG [Clostridia bacterium]